jgi:hypothetical protein
MQTDSTFVERAYGETRPTIHFIGWRRSTVPNFDFPGDFIIRINADGGFISGDIGAQTAFFMSLATQA